MAFEGVFHGGTLRWSITDDAGTAHITLSGEIDMTICDALHEILTNALDRSSDAVLDLGDLRFLDAGGVRTLLRAQHRLGRPVRLRDPSPLVTRVLEASGAIDSFVIERTGYDA